MARPPLSEGAGTGSGEACGRPEAAELPPSGADEAVGRLLALSGGGIVVSSPRSIAISGDDAPGIEGAAGALGSGIGIGA